LVKDHPDVEVVSRDRAGLYAEAAREGAPQARQVADRFHLLQNFRETIERQLGGYEAPIPESHVTIVRLRCRFWRSRCHSARGLNADRRDRILK
jgi:hypothetical protein